MINKKYYIIILLAVSIFIFFFGLGNMALTDPDETFYGETAKEMLQEKEWNTPLIFGNPQFEKPIFYYWLILVSYLMFGVGEFAARFPSAIFGIIGVLGVFLLGKRLYSSLCGFLSALIMATCVQYVMLSRACVTDMVLTVVILLCLLFFINGWVTRKKYNYLIAAGMAAIAVLTKGPIGLFIPGMIIIIYITSVRGWKELKNVPIFSSILVFLVIAMPWYIFVTRVHGSLFLNEFFGFHNIVRFLEPEHRIGSSPFFYIPVIFGGFFPWSFFLPISVLDMYRKKETGLTLQKTGTFLIIWFLVIFLFFSVSRTKLVTYIFPLFPVLAIVVGRFWEQFITSGNNVKDKIGKHLNISYLVFILTMVLGAIGISLFVRYKYPQALPGTILTCMTFIFGILLSLIMFLKNKKTLAFFSIILAVLLMAVPVVKYVLPVIEDFESSKAICFRLKELAQPGEAIGGECDMRRGVAFYTDQVKIEDVHSYDALNEFFSRKTRIWAVLKKKHYDQIKEARPKDVSSPIFIVGKKVLATNILEIQPEEGI
ncbi:MAG: glycosyltransferase family 39 protein [Candidatus Omnitrophica bacterium]|nr:glycosyltransferase family 39 protein [Candidatus Omnitrophota bacterium]